jgi:hypothetical protein
MATIATISTAQSSLLMANTIASSMSFSPRKLAHEMREVFALFVIQYSSLDGGRQRGKPLHSSINNCKTFTAISFLALALQIGVDPPSVENVLQAQTFLQILDI